MAIRLSFFKTPKHRVFNYKPLYYNAEKEELQERLARIRAEMEREAGTGDDLRTREERLHFPGKSIRGSFQKSLYENRRHAGNNRYTRIIMILSILVLLIAVFYFADGLGFLFKTLYNR
ncbi:MAG: hypothetical protein LBC84_02285 [Prevotellaceae bacterium]|jgi:hypothetical protein|nr:hypothetical protein [Prevotellaceae bacterium]